MCLLLFGVKASRSLPFILAANRDEFYQRPTAPMEFWPEKPLILGGKDLKCGGTWFGINTKGRFAALTNYRDLSKTQKKAPSRGDIIVKFLESDSNTLDALETLKQNAAQYNGFNLLVGDGQNLYCFSNQNGEITEVLPGVHGLSNHFLDTPWPKVISGKDALAKTINADNLTSDALFALLSDTSLPPDNLLPDTGVGLEWERRLSPLFIQSPSYGTRSSIVMGITAQGEIQVTERTYLRNKIPAHQDRYFSFFPVNC